MDYNSIERIENGTPMFYHGNKVVIFQGVDILYSEDGLHFERLHFGRSTMRGSNIDADGHYNGQDMHLELQDGQLTLNGTVFWKDEDAPTINIPVRVDYSRVVESIYLCRDNSDLVIVDRRKHEWDYNDFALYVGLPLAPVKIIPDRVTRYRDGGTTDIETSQGLFHQPAPSKKELKATWQGRELEKLDLDEWWFRRHPDTYEIVRVERP